MSDDIFSLDEYVRAFTPPAPVYRAIEAAENGYWYLPQEAYDAIAELVRPLCTVHDESISKENALVIMGHKIKPLPNS